MAVLPEAGSSIAPHFCAFVSVGGRLVELDGSAEEEPIWHGATSHARSESLALALAVALLCIVAGGYSCSWKLASCLLLPCEHRGVACWARDRLNAQSVSSMVCVCVCGLALQFPR